MVPEDLAEGAALSAPESTGEEPTLQRLPKADLSEEATAPTTAEPEYLTDLGIELSTGEPQSGEGAAFGAPGEVADDEEPPRFDALSLLTTSKGEEESAIVTTEQIPQGTPRPRT